MFTEQQIKWLNRVQELFFRYGIKSLTMDDVARELGISKKTLYQFVENKDDLVMKVINRHLEIQCAEDAVIHQQSRNAIEEMFNVIRHVVAEMQQVKPNLIFELQKYHREAWERIETYQRSFLLDIIRKNLEWGRRDGLYRHDFDLEIMARTYIITSSSLFVESWFPPAQFRTEHLFKEVIMNYLHSVASDRGRQLVHQYTSGQPIETSVFAG